MTPAGSRPYPPPRARRRGPAIAIAVVVLVVVVIGVIIAMNLSSSSSGGADSVATLERALDRVPVPPGAVLVDETKIDAKGDREAYVERRYRLTSDNPGTQLRALLAGADFRLVDGRNQQVVPMSSDAWSTYTSGRTGDVNVLPAGSSGGGIELQWTGSTLNISLRSGNAD